MDKNYLHIQQMVCLLGLSRDALQWKEAVCDNPNNGFGGDFQVVDEI